MFSLPEFDQVMCGKVDKMVSNLLHKIKVDEFDQIVESVIKSWFIEKNDPYYPINASHIFAENDPVKWQSTETNSRTAYHKTCKIGSSLKHKNFKYNTCTKSKETRGSQLCNISWIEN